jgi:hypothetical protein
MTTTNTIPADRERVTRFRVFSGCRGGSDLHADCLVGLTLSGERWECVCQCHRSAVVHEAGAAA